MSVASESRSITLASDYLESEIRAQPQIKEPLTEVLQAVQKKLWHQVSTQLLSFLSNSAFTPATLLALQENVVARIYKKLNPFEYVRWGIAISNHVGGGNNLAEGLKHLESIVPHITHQTAGQTSVEQDEQAVLLLQLEITRRQLGLKHDVDGIKDALVAAKKSLDHYSGVMDARVYASYYQASYEYSKVKGNPQDYYTNSLLYLTYTPLASIAPATQAALASDIGLAALLGKNIYNFGELLQHPILKQLDQTEYAWLPKMLLTFNQGNIPEFNKVFDSVKGKYPTLASNAAFLNQKLRIMTLMEMVFRLPSGSKAGSSAAASSSSSSAAASSDVSGARGRFLSFDDIAKGCDLPKEQVEWLLMKSLSLKVIKGEIDQVSQTIRLKWVSPRVLDIEQVKSLKNRLNAWQQEVEQTTVFVENNAAAVL